MKKHTTYTKEIKEGGPPKVNHDQFFNHFFSDPLLAQELPRLFLSRKGLRNLDLGGTRIESGRFGNLLADVVMSVKLKVKSPHLSNPHFLIEHKSYYDKKTIKQLSAYQYLLREKLIGQGILSPIIVLVVFFHGSREDAAKLRNLLLASKSAAAVDAMRLLPEELRISTFNYGIILIDPQDPQVMRRLAEHDFLCRGVVILLDRVNNTEKLPVEEAAAIIRDDFASLFKVQTDYQRGVSVDAIRCYLMHSGNYRKEDWEKVLAILKKYGIDLGDKVKFIEYYMGLGRQEGLQKGLQKGRQEGSQRRQLQIVVNMLKKKFDISVIAEATDLSEDEIQQLSRRNGINNSR